MVNDAGGLLGRQVELVIKDDASNQNTVVSDYNALISQDKVDLLLGTFSSLLNLPASAVAERNQMLYVEPAGGNPDIFNRGFKTIFFAQQATADHQGDVWANYIAALPEDKRPKTAAYPTLDDPFTTPTSEGIEAILKEAGVETVYRKTYTADTTNFDSIANAVKAKNPDLVVAGTQFEDGIGFVRALGKVGFTPKWLYQTNAPSFGDAVRRRRRRREHRGRVLRGQPQPGGQDPGQRGVRRQVPGDVRRRRRARGRGRRATPPARSCRPPSRRTRRSSGTTSSSSPTGCARTRSRRSSAR